MISRRELLLAAGASAVACRSEARPVGPPVVPAPRALGPEFIRGMNVAHLHRRGWGYGSDRARAQAARLQGLGVTHIALNPFAYMPSLSAPEIEFGGDDSLTDDDLRAEVAHLRERGLAVTLKPHIWSWSFMAGQGNGDIELDAVGWARWFDNYTRWAVHNARLAGTSGCTHLCVGLEFTSASRNNPGAWAKVAAACREHFSGTLLYAANWYEEYQLFADWHAFDLVGVNAYFPLQGDTVESLVDSWTPHLDALAAVAKGRPVVFPECGYRAVVGSTERPWEQGGGSPDPAAQARGYEALLRAASARPWFRGAWWWKWFTDLPGEGDPFVPADQPAEAVLRAWNTA